MTMTDEKRILIDDPAVSDPDWIKSVPRLRREAQRRALTAALNESKLKEQTD